PHTHQGKLTAHVHGGTAMTDNERPDAGTDLDRAIDLTVRAMLDVEPRADLRTRVIERLERPRRAVNWAWVVAPVAAAADLVLAVTLSRPAPPQPRRTTDIALHAPSGSPPPSAPRREAPPKPAGLALPHDRRAL